MTRSGRFVVNCSVDFEDLSYQDTKSRRGANGDIFKHS